VWRTVERPAVSLSSPRASKFELYQDSASFLSSPVLALPTTARSERSLSQTAWAYTSATPSTYPFGAWPRFFQEILAHDDELAMLRRPSSVEPEVPGLLEPLAGPTLRYLPEM